MYESVAPTKTWHKFIWHIQGDWPSRTDIFPSRVSGRGYKIGPVCVFVCLSVIQRSHGQTVWDRNLKFGVRFDLDNISYEFEGQGHRSKVKVVMFKNVIFRLFMLRPV